MGKLTASGGYVELKFGPQWKYIAICRAFLQNFLAVSVDDAKKSDTIAMAASELLENGVKYASNDGTVIRVAVTAEEDPKISVRVTNSATAQQAAELKEIFRKVMSGDPLQTYMELMRQAAVREDGKSQLGLARIRYETNARMHLEVSDNNEITIGLDV